MTNATARAIRRVRAFESKLMDAERASRGAECAVRVAETQCPVCYESGRDVAFQCGHRTCGHLTCGHRTRVPGRLRGIAAR